MAFGLHVSHGASISKKGKIKTSCELPCYGGETSYASFVQVVRDDMPEESAAEKS